MVNFYLLGLMACAAWICGGVHAENEDRVIIESMRIVGTVLKPDDPAIKPFSMNNGKPFVFITGQFGAGGELFVGVTKNNTRGIVRMSFGADKELRAKAEKLAGQRVIVECKGEYRLHTGKVTVPQRQGTAEVDQAFAGLDLTLVKIEPAK